MRVLLDSSWMKFGPASRGSYDWVPGSSQLPPTDLLPPGQHWDELPTESSGTGLILYIIIAAASLLFLSLLCFLVYRCCSTSKNKLGVANVIALDLDLDLDDPDVLSSLSRRNTQLLSSFRRHREQFPSTSSDMSDPGVFLMVYLPSPYEETLTKLARVASISSSRGIKAAGPSTTRLTTTEEPQVAVAVEEQPKDLMCVVEG